MSISVRKSIQWLPNRAQEHTSTLVLTSLQHKFFVDVRVLDISIPPSLAVPRAEITASSPLNSPTVRRDPRGLEWAFAGTRAEDSIPNTTATEETVADSTKRERRNSERSKHSKVKEHVRWIHWVDSRTHAPEDVTDEADMEQTSSAMSKETGRMVNPETGKVTDYEEVWQDLAPVIQHSQPFEKGSGLCVVLRAENEALGTRGMVMRVGPWCQGILKSGNDTACERWRLIPVDTDKKQAETRWECLLRVGQGSMPIPSLWEKDLQEGTEVRSGGLAWKCVERSTF